MYEVRQCLRGITAMNKMENGIPAVAFVFSFVFLLVTVMYISVHTGNLPPSYVGVLKIAERCDGTSIGYPAKLTRIYANETSAGAVKNGLIESLPVQYLSASPRNPMSEEAILAKFLDCARHAVRHLTPKKLDTLTQVVLYMEDMKGIHTITKHL